MEVASEDSPQSQPADGTDAHTEQYESGNAEPDYVSRGSMPPPMAPNHASMYAARQQRQLSPSLQAPAAAMAQLLAGKNVSLDSYYANIYGGTPMHMQDLAPNTVDGSAPRESRGRYHQSSVFDRHQMFVMR